MRLRATLAQVFLTRRSGTVEARLVLERESGARERETLTLPVTEVAAAAALLGRVLARRDELESVAQCRVRVARAGELVDDAEARDRLRKAFAAERARQDQQDPAA